MSESGEQPKKKRMSCKGMALSRVNLSCGFVFGIVIGYIAVYSTLDSESRKCTDFKTKVACTSLKHSDCTWRSFGSGHHGICTFKADQCKHKYRTESDCKKNTKDCFWNYGDKECDNFAGMKPIFLGIFAGAMTLGGMFGSFTAGSCANRFGRKPALIFYTSLNLLASILLHIARGVDAYALHVIARFITGLSTGALCVLSPMYTEENAEPHLKGPIGVMFQIGITLGIAFIALMGLIIEPLDKRGKQTFEPRIQFIILCQSVASLVTIIILIFIKESKKYLQDKKLKEEADKGEGNVEVIDETALLDNGHYTVCSMIKPIIIAIIMCLVQQLTGINAIMNYAPQITAQLGLRALVGNFIIMLWNFLTPLLSPVAARFLGLRLMFILAILFATIGLIIVGIPTTPGVTTDKVRQGLGMFGIFLFIAAFEIGMGSAFYVLCMQLYPYPFRPIGSAMTNAILFIFNLIINIFFPIAVVSASGGPSRDQNLGMAAVFFFFTACGVIALPIMIKFLFPFYDSKAGKAALARTAAEIAQKKANDATPAYDEQQPTEETNSQNEKPQEE